MSPLGRRRPNELPSSAGASSSRSRLPAGGEAFCGLVRDPLYGPLLSVGIGGAAVEALSLAAFALAPLDREAALELVGEAPGLAAVAGPATCETLAEALVALGRLALDHPEVAEVDINPVILGADGAVAVDALVVVDRGGSE